MSRYRVSADVTVEVAIEIEAESPEAAEQKFRDEIALSASLCDSEAGDYSVEEDCISDIERVRCAPA